MQSILVCDDDKQIVEAIDIYLTGEGFEVIKAYDGFEALELLQTHTVNLMIIDVMMPGLDGIRTTLKVRETSSIPIIILSAKSEDADKILGLNIGADDYITKPFDLSELKARIIVALRSSRGKAGVMEFGDISLDTSAHSVSVSGEPVRLTRTEYAILKLLISNPEQVITKSNLLDKIAMDTPDCTETSLKMHVSNLRRKLRDISGKDYIESVWGIGFKLRLE